MELLLFCLKYNLIFKNDWNRRFDLQRAIKKSQLILIQVDSNAFKHKPGWIPFICFLLHIGFQIVENGNRFQISKIVRNPFQLLINRQYYLLPCLSSTYTMPFQLLIKSVSSFQYILNESFLWNRYIFQHFGKYGKHFVDLVLGKHLTVFQLTILFSIVEY